TGHMDLSIRADETAGLIDEDRRVVSVRGAGLVGELSVPEAEAKPQAPRLVEQRLRLRPRHLALEERVDLRLIVHPPAGKARRARSAGMRQGSRIGPTGRRALHRRRGPGLSRRWPCAWPRSAPARNRRAASPSLRWWASRTMPSRRRLRAPTTPRASSYRRR